MKSIPKKTCRISAAGPPPLPKIKFVIAEQPSKTSKAPKNKSAQQKDAVSIPWRIFRSLNEEERKAVIYKLETIARGLQISGWHPEKDLPGHMEAKKIRETLESVYRRLQKVDVLIAGMDFFPDLIRQHADRPGDLEIAQRFQNDLHRITTMLGRELRAKTKLFHTRGNVPAMVAGAVGEILQEYGIKTTLAPSGAWAKLVNIIIKAATGKSISWDSVSNAIRKSMKTAGCKSVEKI